MAEETPPLHFVTIHVINFCLWNLNGEKKLIPTAIGKDLMVLPKC